MNREERLTGILALLSEHGSLSVADVTEHFGISPATARRDLDVLQERRLLGRTHGGAVTVNALDYRLSRRYPEGSQSAQIEAIADCAANMVRPGQRIGLSGGRTTTAIARKIAARADLGEGITIVTNAINIAQLLVVRPYIRTVVTGGIVRQGSYELAGPFSDLVLEQITLDVAFIGVNGFDLGVGATVSEDIEAPVNKLMSRRASQAWIAADSSKIGKQAFAVVGAVSEFAGIITDNKIADETHRDLLAAGMQVIVA